MHAQSHTPHRRLGPPRGDSSTRTRSGRAGINRWSALLGALAVALIVVVALAIGDLSRGGPGPVTTHEGAASGGAGISVDLPGGFTGMQSEGVIHAPAGYSPPGIIGPISSGLGGK